MVELKAAIISLGSESSGYLDVEMKKLFDVVDNYDLRDMEVNLSKRSELLHQGKPFSDYDCIYLKGSFRQISLLQSISYVLENFHKDTYSPLKTDSYFYGHDKILNYLALQKRNVPMPKTYIAASSTHAKKILEKINYPVIMKFPQGTHGKGVVVVESFASASSVLDALVLLGQPFFIQEFIDTDGTDIRCIVVGDEVVACMKRKSINGDIRANVHAGGVGEKYSPSSEMKRIAIEAAKSINADVCAVDILESPTGPKVIEVNVSPGLQGITEATKINVAEKIAKFLFKKTEELKKVSTKQLTKKIMSNLTKEDLKDEILKNNLTRIINSKLKLVNGKIILPEMVSNFYDIKNMEDVIIKIKGNELIISKQE